MRSLSEAEHAQPTVIMTVGLPGSGKSTWARRYAAEHGFSVHSSDDMRRRLYGDEAEQGSSREVFEKLYAEVDYDLEKGISVIIDSTALTRGPRYSIRRYHEAGFRTVAAVMDTPDEVCIERNRARDRVVPDDVMQEMLQKRVFPDESEGFDEIIYIPYSDDPDSGKESM